MGIAAMPSGVDDRPNPAAQLHAITRPPDDQDSMIKQAAASNCHRLGEIPTPGKRLQQPLPCPRLLAERGAGDAPRQQFLLDSPQPWLGWRSNTFVHFFEPFTPPSEADRAELRFAGRSNHVPHRGVESEQCCQGCAIASRHISGGKLLVWAELKLSDR